MHIGFIEDTLLRGGTQIWVTEAVAYYLAEGEDVTVLTPQGAWVAEECRAIGANVVTYDYEHVEALIWESALRNCDVVVCTVHPPRDDFHCSVFAAECIRNGNLKTILIPKTGTIVPSYKREFYLPDERIQSYVISIADFTRRYLLDDYKLPAERVKLIYQGVNISHFSPSPARNRHALE